MIDRAIRRVMGGPTDERDVDWSSLGAEAFGYALSRDYGTPDAGEMVTVESAMRAALGAAVRLLADDISGLPVGVYARQDGQRVQVDTPDWLEQPGLSRFDTLQALLMDMVTSLLTDGNIFLDCNPSTASPVTVRALPPDIVKVDEDDMGLPVYEVNNGLGQRLGRYTDDRIAHVAGLRLPGERRGMNNVEQAREFTGLELAARRWAGNFFANGATLGGVVVLPKEAKKPTKDEVAALRQQFEFKHKGNRKSWLLGILTGGATIVDGAIKPQEAELAPLWGHVLEEACRLYHVPPHMLASQAGAAAFASVEHRSIEYVQHAVIPVVNKIEAVLTAMLPPGQFVRFNVDELLRGDMKTRAETKAIQIGHRVITRDEWRASEDLGPAPEGEGGYLLTPNSAVPDPKYEELSKLIRAGFDPQESLAYLGMDSLTHLGFSPTTQYDIPDEDADDGSGGNLTGTEGPAQDELSRALGAFNRTVQAIVRERDQDALPKSTRIERDDRGRAVAIVERRGDKVTRRKIERDAQGNAVGFTEEGGTDAP